ncbi:27525_t:CDS:1, partial [Racocetra persica]
ILVKKIYCSTCVRRQFQELMMMTVPRSGPTWPSNQQEYRLVKSPPQELHKLVKTTKSSKLF